MKDVHDVYGKENGSVREDVNDFVNEAKKCLESIIDDDLLAETGIVSMTFALSSLNPNALAILLNMPIADCSSCCHLTLSLYHMLLKS